MRFWSIHPSYLDLESLTTLWQQGLLAKKILQGKAEEDKNHPQLLRFKKCQDPLLAMDVYLETVFEESKKRKSSFDGTKIRLGLKMEKMSVTRGQIAHELKHLNYKIDDSEIKLHPLFTLIKGRVEQWEKVADNLKSFPYDLDFKKVDFRKHPELYKIGKGEQGVLMVEPYKSEILPHWRFKNPEIAEKSAKKILSLFNEYKKQKDFVGMDMARKFLQMGYTRSRRYANHSSGRKYTTEGKIKKQDSTWHTSEKAESARIFYEFYLKAREDKVYKKMKVDLLAKTKVG